MVKRPWPVSLSVPTRPMPMPTNNAMSPRSSEAPSMADTVVNARSISEK